MTKRKIFFLLGAVALAAAFIIGRGLIRPHLVLTGIVTTDESIVSAEIQGRLEQLSVSQGDVVKRGQLLGAIVAAEQKADLAYFESLELSASAQVAQAEAELNYQRELNAQQVTQAEANLAAAESLVTQAEADANIAQLTFARAENLRAEAINSPQDYDQARAVNESAKARVAALRKQAAAARAALGLAQAGSAQITARASALAASRQQLAAARAQKEKAAVHFGRTEVRAPIDGVVNVRAALTGEVINPGQAIVTLIDPANLWVRVDVEESYIDRIHLGDTLPVRLPSGAERTGTVFFRGVDASYATQRDVSRTKRDIKTFELRLRCDNHDQSLATGMTAYVTLPFAR